MTEKKTPKFIDAKRRGFMQGATVASAAAVAGVASTAADAIEIEPVAAKKISGDRYQESDYVRAYYRNARF